MTIEQFSRVVMVINMLSAAVILSRGVVHISHGLSRDTFFHIRMAWVLITTGALAALLGPIFGLFIASVPMTLVLLGVAFFLAVERGMCEVSK